MELEKYHHEWGNLDTKGHIWYILTDKLILTQKLRRPKVQFTDCIKIKKEDQSVDASVLLKRGNKIPMGGKMETKCGAETDGKAIQRLLHLQLHRIYNHQIHTLLQMPRSACWQEPDTSVSWEALSDPEQYRCWCLQPTIGLSTGNPMEELGEGMKELKGLQPPKEICRRPSHEKVSPSQSP